MEKIDPHGIIQRIRKLREQFSGPRGKSEFAHALAISPSTYNYYERDRVPPIEVLLKICEATGTDIEWLLTGRESSEKFAFAKKLVGTGHSKVITSGVNPVLLRKLNVLLNENPDLGAAVSAFIDLLAEKKGLENRLKPNLVQSHQQRPGWIPVLGRTAAGLVHFWDRMVLPKPEQAVTELDEIVRKHTGKAITSSVDGTVTIDLRAQALVDGLKSQRANLIQVGESVMPADERETDVMDLTLRQNSVQAGSPRVVEFVECEAIHKLFPDSFALQIDGDSMSPRINDGDIVILSPSVPAAQGQAAVVRVANQIGVTCKLIRTTQEQVHLIPINERYETKVVSKGELLWALAVLCHIKVSTQN
jgi:transcriptional regulator with XRE-family HTH domain